MMLFLFSACRFNPDTPSAGADYLYGTWIQDSVAMQENLLQYTLHELTVASDSIYITLHTTAKTQKTTDSCYNNGHWTEHVRGIYVVRGDSLLVEGWYRQPDGQLKTSGCHHIGKYRPRFKIVHHSTDSLVLEEHIDRRLIALRKQ